MVLVKGRCFLLTAFQQNRLCSKAQLRSQVRQILEQADLMPSTHLASLTALAKAEAIQGLARAHAERPREIEAAQGASLCLSIMPSLAGDGDHANQLVGLTGEGNDRWFGKTSLVADPLGHVGFYVDHAIADGLIVKQFMEMILEARAAPDDDGGKSRAAVDVIDKPVSLGPFSQALESAWQQATRSYRQRLSRLSSAQFSLALPAEGRRSLIGALPLAAQAAFYAHKGRVEAPYLPVSKRHAAARGLEFIHASPPQAGEVLKRFAKEPSHGHEGVEAILSWWNRAISRTIKSSGGERYLHYLYRHAQAEGGEQDAFFLDAGFPDCLSYPQLCLSVIASRAFVPGLAFPPVEEGWGLGANMHQAGVNVTVTSWDGRAAAAAEHMRCSLIRIVERRETAPPPGQGSGSRDRDPIYESAANSVQFANVGA